jgi:predicted MPP superfamily phosphohydrolase
VFWIFARADESVARELSRLASVLSELEGQVVTHSFNLAEGMFSGLGSGWMNKQRLSGADVIVVLCSPALLHGSEGGAVIRLASMHERARGVLVNVSPVTLPRELAALPVLPRDGKPIMAHPDHHEAMLEVLRGLQEVISLQQTPLPRSVSQLHSGRATPGLPITKVFELEGPPTFTFVEPPRFRELKLALRTMGSGLIVEGPSKVGKSTAIRKAMDELGAPKERQIWWSGLDPLPLDELGRTLKELLGATHDTWLFIDDFHHLEDERYQRSLASIMKVLADQPERHAKITLIGINPLGDSLVQVMPDLSGRFRVLRLDIDKDWRRTTKIAELIIQGEQAANIRFKRRDDFVLAAAGSFFLAQSLCQFAAVTAGVDEVPQELVEIELGPADVVAAIQGELAARFRAPMRDFAAFDTTPSPRGAGLSLLWLLSRSDGATSVREARLRFPMLATAFDWLLESNLTRCLQTHPRLKGLLYYNRTTQTLTMEDPQLRFYLRELSWEEFAEASGHGDVRFHPEDGPLWPISGPLHVTPEPVTGSAAAASPSTGAGSTAGVVIGSTPGQVLTLLHLSDLHFATKDQATVWYSQLAADLREQQIDRLDALVVSGDLVERADPAEYDAARLFLEKLMAGFALPAQRVVLVPGNHDVSWPLSQEAYRLHRRKQYSGSLVPGTYVEHGGDIVEVRDEAAYRERLQPFAELYRAIKGTSYPLAFEEQGTLDDFADASVCILGLNSAWEADHHHPHRASIHLQALANALVKLGPPAAGQLRIAVFHHPIHGGEDSCIRDAAVLQQLAVHGFRLVLHGHVHKADAELYRYERSEGGRRVEIVAAGTFGANTREWVPGYPLQYNLLLVGPERITVETRCRREVNGAWEPDARWRQGPGKDPLPRYVIDR